MDSKYLLMLNRSILNDIIKILDDKKPTVCDVRVHATVWSSSTEAVQVVAKPLQLFNTNKRRLIVIERRMFMSVFIGLLHAVIKRDMLVDDWIKEFLRIENATYCREFSDVNVRSLVREGNVDRGTRRKREREERIREREKDVEKSCRI